MKSKLIIAGWYEITDAAGEVYELKMAQHGRISRNDGWTLRDSKGSRIAHGRTKAEVMEYFKDKAGAY